MIPENTEYRKRGAPEHDLSKQDLSSGAEMDLELDEIVSEFEAAIARGASVELAEFAPDPSHPRYAEILCELIRVDMELASEAGRPFGKEEYRRRYPVVFMDAGFSEAIAFEESRLRASGIVPQERYPDAGERIGEFEFVCELGRGAFSRVYLAKDTSLAQRLVVLKVSSQFQGEAATLSRLQHKNIVPIYSMIKHGHFHVVCMPFLGSATLDNLRQEIGRSASHSLSGQAMISTLNAQANRTIEQHYSSSSDVDRPSSEPGGRLASSLQRLEILRRFQQMSFTELSLWIVSELADGLEHAHQRGILHRDIKPANVLLTDDGVPMLLDFNLAADFSPESQAKVFGGTLRYMAIEQLEAVKNRQGEIDVRADVFSLGVILYELLNRKSAFPERKGKWSDTIDLMIEDRKKPPQQSVDWEQQITPAVAAIVQKTMAIRPEDRYQSAADLRVDLQRHLGNLPTVYAKSHSWQESIQKWNRRHPRASATTLVGTIAAIIVLTLASALWVRQSNIRRLEAENWIVQLEKARTMARTLPAGDRIPSSQIESVLGEFDRIGSESMRGRHLSRLSGEHAEQAKRLLSELSLYAARGRCRLAERSSEGARIDQLFSQAMVDCREAISLDSQNAAATVLGEAIERFVQASAPLALEERKAATQLVHSSDAHPLRAEVMKSMFSESSNAWYWLCLGQLSHETGDIRAATSELTLAERLAPELPWPTFLLGILELDQRNFARAIERFDRVIGLDRTIPKPT